ncbi:hypothetical protein ASG76_09185 [Nocardioides sp. Soil774]|uniref:glycosyltransferase family 87 protein n=1 Tax=Nocardioides sp. Soil774 TaxID=1736408 RepID=UPI0007023B29|nr:glycosyltransferase family 87 protein [Nocardioides sp. Soil774]KRE94585.1 hypothetical protein ASG76_09185 [Nocardioides sp. Soil774]
MRVYPRLFLAMFVLATPLYASTFHKGLDSWGRPLGTDFIAFWSAGRLALHGRAVDAWDLDLIGAFELSLYPGLAGPTQWAYPPTTLALVIPFGALPHLLAFAAWVVIGLAVYLFALAPLIRGHAHAWPVALAFPGLWLGIPSGQVQFFVAALMGAALLLLPRRPVLAGILIGLLVIKPQMAVLLPIALVAGREWKAFAAAAITSIMAVAASTMAFGVSAYDAWWSSLGALGAAIDDGSAPVFKFVTPFMGLRVMGVPEVPALLLHGGVAVAAATVVWRLWRRSDDPRIRGTATVVGTFLVTPYAADYDLAVLAFPIAWMAILGTTDGWLRGDRNTMVAAWVLPMVVAPITLLTHVTLAPLVCALVLRQLWARTSAREGSNVD